MSAADNAVAIAQIQSSLQAIDAFYLMMLGAVVFFMQAGFALLEAGSVRAKNTKNILLKNLLDACLGAIIWWAWGYGASYGSDGGGDGWNGFIGSAADNNDFFLKGPSYTESTSGYGNALWFFQYVFAAAAATIVSGAVAERAQLGAYLIYTVIITGFIYPVQVHMTWSTHGALSGAFNGVYEDTIIGGNLDFAGSGVVHMTGGILALCGAAIIGPRVGRFDEDGKPNPMPGQNSVLIVLGTLILWLGWYGFNPGSTLGITAEGYGTVMGRAAVTTTISAAAGGITTVVIDRAVSQIFDLHMVCNGILAGLVSITAGCASTYPWAAFCIGVVGAFVYYGASKLLLKLKIDDPLDAFAVHGAAGFWGVLAVGFFAAPEYVGYGWKDAVGADFCYAECYKGLFYGGGSTFAGQLVALIVEVSWCAATGVILFWVLRLAGILRISAEMENAGLDTSKHGGSAFNVA